MQSYPQNLISTQDITEKIKEAISKNCTILRRTDLEEYLTPYDELDVELIRDIDLFRMSTNVLLCKREELGLDNQIKHVNIVILEGNNSKFEGENTITEKDLGEVKAELKKTLILGFKIDVIEGITGPYVFGEGTKKEIHLNYNIKVSYDPLVLNCYHMESIINCMETGDEISRREIKGYRKAIASDIKVKLMNKKKVEIYNYEDVEQL